MIGDVHTQSLDQAPEPQAVVSSAQWPQPFIRVLLRTSGRPMDLAPLLRTELLVSLGFVTSAAVILVGLTTLVLTGGDLRDTIRPLAALWLGSTAVFVLFGVYVVHRLVIRPLQRLTLEADALAAGQLSASQAGYGSMELDRLAERYRAMAEDLLDV